MAAVRIPKYEKQTDKYDRAWMSDAACVDDDPRNYNETFEEKPPVDIQCHWCPVRAQCLSYAIANKFDGIWGGTTEKQRTRLTRRQRRARCPSEECGGREIKRGGRSDTCINCGLSWPALPAAA